MDTSATKHPSTIPESRQNQMAEAFRNLQQCVQHCQKAVFFTDGAGILQRVNPAFEKLTGYTATESVGKDLSWITAEGPTCKSYRQIWKEIFEDRAFRGALEVRRKNGERFQMDLTAIPVRNKGGEIVSLVCTGRDLSQEKEREAQLIQIRRMNVAAALSRALIHDLNNELMIVSGYVERALEGMPAENSLWRNLQEIRAAALRACELGRDLTFGHSEKENPGMLSINSVVEEVARLLPQIIGPEFEVDVVLGKQLGQVEASVRQLREMLLHLAITVREAAATGGKLVIQTNGVGLHAPDPTGVPAGKYAVLSIRATKLKATPAWPGAAAVHEATRETGVLLEPAELQFVEELAKENHGFLRTEIDSDHASIVDIYLPVAGEPVGASVRAHAAGAGG